MSEIASHSLHPYQPRAWLRHTPYLRAAQNVYGVCGMHAFFA